MFDGGNIMAERRKINQEKSYISYEHERILNLAKDLRRRVIERKSIIEDNTREVSTFGMVKEIVKEVSKKVKIGMHKQVEKGILLQGTKFGYLKTA